MRYMDYEEFNKEYDYFTEWWRATSGRDADYSASTDKLIWGTDRDFSMLTNKDVIQFENKNTKNDEWLKERNGIVTFGSSEDAPWNNITPTGFIPDDRVNSPSHYTSGKQEAIDIIEDAIKDAPNPTLGMLQAQVLKYMLRLWLKDNTLEDASKAEWYLKRLIKALKS